MTTKTTVDVTKPDKTNARPEPIGLRVRTAVKAGFNFTTQMSKSSPILR